MDLWLLKYKLKHLLFPTRIVSEEYVKYLQKMGVSIGKGSHFFYPCSNTVDIQRPWMLKIGEYCKITEGVSILTHDYSRSVLRRKYGEIIGEAQFTSIGDNVFIGMKSIILMGATIGNNVIIGAGSVVKGNIPSDCVASGVPAKVICTLEEYYKKRKDYVLDEAVCYTSKFYEKNKRFPSIPELGAFFPLFMERKYESLIKNNVNVNLSGDDIDDIVECFLNSSSQFESYDSFIEYVKNQKQ